MKKQSVRRFIYGGSTISIVIILIFSIFLFETLVMLVLDQLPPLSYSGRILLDSTLLLIVMVPLLYLFVFRSMSIMTRDLKRNEDSLYKSIEQIKEMLSITEATLASIHNGILVVDNHGKVLRTNTIFENMWHIPEEILALKDDKSLINCIIDQLDEPEKFLAKVADLYRNPQSETIDEIHLIDGHIFQRISKPLFIEGTPNGRVWSFLDITENKNATITIDNERLLLRTLINNIPDSIYCKDLDCRKTLVNMTEMKFLGRYSEAEVLGKDDFYFFPKELAEGFFADDQIVLKTGQPVVNREEFIPADVGKKRWILTSKLPLYDHDGQITGLLGIGRDITERKHIEDLLRQSEEKYRMMIDNIGEGIGFMNSSEEFEFVNNAAESIFGVEPGKLTGMNLLQFIDQSQYDLILSETAKRAKGDASINELEIVRPNGERRIIIITTVSQTDTDKGFLGTYGVFRDITERKEAEAEIKLKNEQLLKMNAEKDKFFSIISHDLRGPFNGFLGFTELLVEELPDLSMEEIRNMAIDMKKSATNLFRLLENLLQWSRIKQGSLPFDTQNIRLMTVLKDIVGIMEEAAKIKGIELTYSIQSDLPVYADINIIQLVIRNLISNAIKFASKGGTVILSAELKKDQSVEIAISDTGIGMNRKIIDNLFRLDVPTNRTGTAGEPSSGLGLILCKEFIELHGGKLWVESLEGKGSIFHFSLPCQTLTHS